MSNYLGNESRIQTLVSRMIDEAASGKGHGFSAIGTGLLIAFLRALALILVFCRLIVWLCKTKQWVRLALTVCWLAGGYAGLTIMPSPSGPVWHFTAWFAGYAAWLLLGINMNDTAIRASNGLPPRTVKHHA